MGKQGGQDGRAMKGRRKKGQDYRRVAGQEGGRVGEYEGESRRMGGNNVSFHTESESEGERSRLIGCRGCLLVDALLPFLPWTGSLAHPCGRQLI
jgi:hypothetical protein